MYKRKLRPREAESPAQGNTAYTRGAGFGHKQSGCRAHVLNYCTACFSLPFFFFKFFFSAVDHFKAFIEFVTILFLFYVLVSDWEAYGILQPLSPTRDQTCVPRT